MDTGEKGKWLDEMKGAFPEKFASEHKIFGHIHAGDRIFIGSGCGEPQYLIRALIRYVESEPKAFFDTEVVHVYSFGIAPYTDDKFKQNFRHTSFFIGSNTRDPINRGLRIIPRSFYRKFPIFFIEA